MRFDLIAYDLDGTVLRNDGSLPDETIAVLREAAAAGCILVPTTGRTLSEIPPILVDSSLSRYLILSNGASVMEVEEDLEIMKGLIPTDIAVKIFHYLLTSEVSFVAYSEGVAFCDEKYMSDLVSFYSAKGRHFAQIVENMRFVASIPKYFEKASRSVEKIFIHQIPEEKREVILRFLETLPGLDASESSPMNLEINAKDITKGAALQALAQLLEIPRDRVMAIGDGENDLSMLAYAGFSVAVANAVPLAKSIASYTTVSNDENGAASAIRKFCVLSR
jgi:Cof subfamily protein (haloacid dehalogenase superfamily)